MPQPIQSRLQGFEDRHTLLWMGLGLLALGDRLERLLAAAGSRPDDGSTPPPDERLVEVALGVVSLRGKLLDLLAVAAGPSPPLEPEGRPEPGTLPLRELLR